MKLPFNVDVAGIILSHCSESSLGRAAALCALPINVAFPHVCILIIDINVFVHARLRSRRLLYVYLPMYASIASSAHSHHTTIE